MEQRTEPALDLERYRDLCREAEADPGAFWLGVARERLAWMDEPKTALTGDPRYVQQRPLTWFESGILNATETCLDAHLWERGDNLALRWEGDQGGSITFTYQQLADAVNRMANGLKALGLQKGERVAVVLDNLPEAVIALLAIARAGGVHAAMPASIAVDALRQRLAEIRPGFLITQDEAVGGGRRFPVKATVDAALDEDSPTHTVLVVRRTGERQGWKVGRDLWWENALDGMSEVSAPARTGAADPLFLSITSGKPLVFAAGGYLAYAAWTHRALFGAGGVVACLSDVSRPLAHAHLLYGPLANGATALMTESVPPADRLAALLQDAGVTSIYAPSEDLAQLAGQGFSVPAGVRAAAAGAPLPADARAALGAIHETWWQAGTGGACLAALPGVEPGGDGSVGSPLPGHLAVLIDAGGRPVAGPGEGTLCLARPWPGQATTCWQDHAAFVAKHYRALPGAYFTGKRFRRDAEGRYWAL